MSELEKLIMETTNCTDIEAKLKAKSMTSNFVIKNPEFMVKIQLDLIEAQNDKIQQLSEDKFVLASNHLAFMACKPKPSKDIDFLSLKGMELPIKAESFDNFVIENKLGLSQK